MPEEERNIERQTGRDNDSPRETVIVTGSSGLIGYAAANRFAERFRVVGFDRDEPPPRTAGIAKTNWSRRRQ